MPDHDDTVAYREQQVAPPGDLRSHTDGAGFLVFTGTCPVCHARNSFSLVDVVPGTVSKGLPWRRSQDDGPGEWTMDCRCPITHPSNVDEFSGCGAWWTVRLPPQGAP
ncbi:hypothetical protein [Streptomyces sp. IBSBF 2435]|uniref:hypothetical protein n=1 Tax=Streptomyces sp. IBSBF 2435 TaxID=2903531 RepID=UPI002FDC400D